MPRHHEIRSKPPCHPHPSYHGIGSPPPPPVALHHPIWERVVGLRLKNFLVVNEFCFACFRRRREPAGGARGAALTPRGGEWEHGHGEDPPHAPLPHQQPLPGRLDPATLGDQVPTHADSQGSCQWCTSVDDFWHQNSQKGKIKNKNKKATRYPSINISMRVIPCPSCG